MADTVPVHKAQWSITGLPDGLTADLTVGKLSGTPTASGAYSPEVTVATKWGSVTRNISLVVVNLQAKYTIRQGGEDLEEVTLPDLIGMIRAGTAQTKYNTDDTQLVVPWTNPLNGTVYACPMDFCSFRNVELEDGTIKPGLILQCGYGLPHYGIQFDKAEKTRNCGDTRWRTSNLRQWLNARGRDWFTPTHDEDREPFTYNTCPGFLDSFPADFTYFLVPIKVQTQVEKTAGDNVIDVTYDTFFLPSLEEFNATGLDADKVAAAGVEGTAWEHWVSQSRVHYAVNNTTQACPLWIRSAYLANTFYVWSLSASGEFDTNIPNYYGPRIAPACVLC